MMAHLHLTKEMQNSKQQQQQQQQQHHQNNKSAGESEKNNMTNEKGSNEERANDGTPLSPLGMAFNDRPKVTHLCCNSTLRFTKFYYPTILF
jgi:membrane protease subunit (stomatin/prohibitin family)